ncbi:B-box type zinc finger protein with CCT domain [Striga asiatica]|uniref:B-box type zinc finger protein with CCT domain n=1 Tax=Striga asiatica TaxID=4170 RepID=A0A5A7PI09_STRAF|nr:B-box type zinc finger protein with CCT domain [Striga asiatica]
MSDKSNYLRNKLLLKSTGIGTENKLLPKSKYLRKGKFRSSTIRPLSFDEPAGDFGESAGRGMTARSAQESSIGCAWSVATLDFKELESLLARGRLHDVRKSRCRGVAVLAARRLGRLPSLLPREQHRSGVRCYCCGMRGLRGTTSGSIVPSVIS